MKAFRTNKTDPSAQKLRGGYYTPPALAAFLAKWAIRSGKESVLEPSCGDGNFVVEALALLDVGGTVTAVEIEKRELAKTLDRCSWRNQAVRPVQGDFFDHFSNLSESRFDVVLGNPPFIRFQHFEASARDKAFGELRKFGYKPNGLANAWCAFVQLSAELLMDGGRMALVVPAELLQVGYAQELRDRLPKMFDDVAIVAFDELVFPDIQQEVVLLLADGRRRGNDRPGSLHVLQVPDGKALIQSDVLAGSVCHLPERHTRAGMKWTSLFLKPNEFDMMDRIQRRSQGLSLGNYAEVDVGVVTGRNSFFVMMADQADKVGVNGYAVPTVGRTSALKSIIFEEGDLRAIENSTPTKLLNLKGISEANFSKNLISYIKAGESDGVHHGYKCRIRPRWFDVPSIYVPDAFIFRQIHNAPFMVANLAAATATDTIHRVRVKEGIDTVRLCAASINSLTFAWAEVCGRSYGGGVLELEPSEAEELPNLYEFAEGIDVSFIDQCLRQQDIGAALDYADDYLLVGGLGLKPTEVKSLRLCWDKLRSRRQRRRSSK